MGLETTRAQISERSARAKSSTHTSMCARLLCYGPVRLCSRRVPNLQLDFLCADIYHPHSEFDADGDIMSRLKAVIEELHHQA